MAADDSKSATGGTGGTGQTDTAPETQSGAVAERERANGDDAADAAIGDGGGERVSGTGSGIARSGRLSSEGTGAALPNPPDPGDPGGMGGVAANCNSPRGRPPGGVSTIGEEEG